MMRATHLSRRKGSPHTLCTSIILVRGQGCTGRNVRSVIEGRGYVGEMAPKTLNDEWLGSFSYATAETVLQQQRGWDKSVCSYCVPSLVDTV